MMMTALDAGAEDFNADDEAYEIITSPVDFATVCDNLRNLGYEFASSQIDRIPQMTVPLEGVAAEKFIKMIDMFDENDDVQNVFHNAELPETDEEDE